MITTVITSSVQGLGVMMSVVGVIALVAFLCVKQLATATDSSPRRSLGRFLDVGIIPLAIAFAMIVAMEIVRILN